MSIEKQSIQPVDWRKISQSNLMEKYNISEGGNNLVVQDKLLATMEGVILQLTQERDEWKAKALAEVDIVKDQGELTFKLADNLGGEIGEANRLLNECERINNIARMRNGIYWTEEFREEIRAHLQKYKPYQE